MSAITYAMIAWPFLAALLLGVAVPLLMLATYRHLGAGLTVIGVAWAAEILTMSRPVLYLGIFVHVADLLLVLLALVALARWVLSPSVPRRYLAWGVVVAVFFVGLAWGLVQYGRAAGVQARPDFYAIAAASYVMSFPLQQDGWRVIVRLLWAMAIVTLLVCIYRWIVFYTPIPELLPRRGTYNVDGDIRVVPANAALLLAQLLMLGLFFGGGREAVLHAARLAAPVLLALVLVLQHRSVWLAAIVGALAGLMLTRAQQAPRWQQALLALSLAVMTLLPLLSSSFLAGQLSSSAQRALSGSDTVADRFQNWRATLRQWVGDGPVAIAVGRVRGADARRVVADDDGGERVIEYQAHNHYVSTLAQGGVIGLAAYAWLLVALLRALIRAVRRADDNARAAALWLPLLAMQLAYFVAYGVEFIQYTILGLALAWVAGQRPADTAQEQHRRRAAWRDDVAWR